MDLIEKLIEFSRAGIRKHPSKNLPLYGIGCCEWTWSIVKEVVDEWLDEEGSTKLRKANYNLGMVVDAVVTKHTANGFKWSKVCAIVKASGDCGFTEKMLEALERRYPLCTKARDKEKVDSMRTHEVVRMLARHALFAEVVTFLEYEGYGDRLTK